MAHAPRDMVVMGWHRFHLEPRCSEMPTISAFYGILIQMFWKDHAPPHFHAVYAEHEAKLDIRTLEVLDGQLPSRALALVLEWGRSPQARVGGELETMRSDATAEQDFASGITPSVPWRISAIEVLPAHRLKVQFLDGTEGTVDMSRLVFSEHAGVFENLPRSRVL